MEPSAIIRHQLPSAAIFSHQLTRTTLRSHQVTIIRQSEHDKYQLRRDNLALGMQSGHKVALVAVGRQIEAVFSAGSRGRAINWRLYGPREFGSTCGSKRCRNAVGGCLGGVLLCRVLRRGVWWSGVKWSGVVWTGVEWSRVV